MLALDPHAEDHLVVGTRLVRDLELFLLPPEGHLRKTDHLGKHLHLHHVVIRKLESQRLAVVVLIVVRVTPAVAVQQVAPMPHVLVVVEFELVPFAGSLEHDSEKHPGSHVEPAQFDIHLALGLTCLHKSRPVHLLVTCLDHPVADSEEVFAGVGADDGLGLDLPRLENGLLRLLVVLLTDYGEPLVDFDQGGFLVLEFVSSPGMFILQLLVVLDQFVVASCDLTEFVLEDTDFCLLGLDDLTVFVFLGLDQGIELRVIHEHLLLDLGVGNQDLLLEVLPLGVGVVHQFLHAVDLDEEAGVLDFLVPDLQEPFFEGLGESAECGTYLVGWFAVVVETHFDVEFLPEQEEMLLDFVHQFIDDAVHVLQHRLPRQVLLHLLSVLGVEAPL